MLHRAACYLLAAIQVIIGWEWITSGTIKVLSGNFPQGLSNTLQQGGETWYSRLYQHTLLGLRRFIGIEDAPRHETAGGGQ